MACARRIGEREKKGLNVKFFEYMKSLLRIFERNYCRELVEWSDGFKNTRLLVYFWLMLQYTLGGPVACRLIRFYYTKLFLVIINVAFSS